MLHREDRTAGIVEKAHDGVSRGGFVTGGVLGVGREVGSWSAYFAASAACGVAYDALRASPLPLRSVSLSYEFPPPTPELVPRFRTLCTIPEDSFVISLGSFAVGPGLPAKLEVEIDNKGLELNVIMEGELDENDELPSEDAMLALSESLPRLLDLPLASDETPSA